MVPSLHSPVEQLPYARRTLHPVIVAIRDNKVILRSHYIPIIPEFSAFLEFVGSLHTTAATVSQGESILKMPLTTFTSSGLPYKIMLFFQRCDEVLVPKPRALDLKT